MKQFVITPAMGKRLIGQAVAAHAAVQAAVDKGILVVVAGSTNGYVAEEILKKAGQGEGFSPVGFRRGMVVPPDADPASIRADFAGDVVLVDGAWRKGKTIFDVVDDMKTGDVVIKGANAVHLAERQASVLIGDPKCGTAGALLPAVVGRRIKLIVPVGVEKRVDRRIGDLAELLNAPGAAGPRMLPLSGEVLTELDAIRMLTGATARLVAAGGVHGAEGAAWVAIYGDDGQEEAAADRIRAVQTEPPCRP